MDTFKTDYQYSDREEIVTYAGMIGIAPYILVGRLQHDGLLVYSDYNDLIPCFEILE